MIIDRDTLIGMIDVDIKELELPWQKQDEKVGRLIMKYMEIAAKSAEHQLSEKIKMSLLRGEYGCYGKGSGKLNVS